MEPLTVAGTCTALVTSISKILIKITIFVQQVRAARRDLDSVSRELYSLKTLLGLLAHDTSEERDAVTPSRGFLTSLEKYVVGVVGNCSIVIGELEKLLQKYSDMSMIRKGQ